MSEQERTVVMITAGTGNPSSTHKLGAEITDSVVTQFSEAGVSAHKVGIDLVSFATDLATAVASGFISEGLRKAMAATKQADAVVVATPVYKAAPSGMFKMFIDILDEDTFLGTPTILAATAGSQRHALVVDGQLRELFAFMRAMSVPTSIFAATEDWQRPMALQKRIERAARETVALVVAGVKDATRSDTLGSYRRVVDPATTAKAKSDDATDAVNAKQPADLGIDPDLLAAIRGGSLPPR